MASHSYSKEAKQRYQTKYEKTRLKQIKLALNDSTDADIIAFLETIDNKRGYLLDLIRTDMSKRAGE